MRGYKVDGLTVIRTDEHGECFDLNAAGEPCRDVRELREFIETLHEQGAFSDDVRRDLIISTLPDEPC